MSWLGYADAADLARAEEVARNETRRAKEEKERADREKKNAVEARKQASESESRAKVAEERARKESHRVKEEKELAEQERMASTKAKEEAAKSAIRAEQAEEQAQKESHRANEEKELAEQERTASAKAKEEAAKSAIRAEQAEEQAQKESHRANEEKELAEQERKASAKAKEEAATSATSAEQERKAAAKAKEEAATSAIKAKVAEEQAQKESHRANEQKELAEQERNAAAQAKEEAAANARTAEQAKEQAQTEKLRALEAHEIAKQERDRAEEARAHAEKEARISEEMRKKKESAEQEKKHLLDERDEKERRDEILMQFAWGPKKTERGRWTSQEVQQLRDKFYGHMHDKEGRLIHGKILIFGPSGAGKSSFCNGLRTALNDFAAPTTYYAVGNHDTSLTRTFQSSQYGDHWIIDMPGIFESSDFKTERIEAIASGRVRFDAQIINWKTLEVKSNQQQARRDVSCVVLVLHHGITLGDELKRQLNAIIRLGGEGALSYHLVLTHLDQCDPQFKDPENIPNLYNSPRVQEAVKMMSEQTGIPPYAISYVKNYVTETNTHTNTKFLHLEALDRILTTAAEQVEKMIDFKLQKNMYENARVSWKIAVFISAAVMCVCSVVYMCTQ